MNLKQDFPIIPHESVTGVDCCGCIVPQDFGADYIRLRCNECGKEIGLIRTGILADLVELVNRAATRKR